MQTSDSYNKGGFIAFLFAVFFSLAFMFYIAFFNGIDLKEVKAQKAAAEAAAGEKVVDVSKVTNPWVSSDDLIANGKKVYGTYCAMCHGEKGLGDGAAGASLSPKPRNFVEGKWKMGGKTKDLYMVLQNGIPGSSMVSFKASIKPIDRWSLVHYIRSITQNKVPDDEKALEAFAKTAD